MQKLYFNLIALVLASFLIGCARNAAAQANKVTSAIATEKLEATIVPEVVSKNPPADCPVTVAQDPAFTPPAPYDALGSKSYFWYGSSSLWTAVPADAVWYSLPHNPEGYTQKVFWWRDGYVWNEEPEPNLIVTGERLDAQKTAPLNVSKATNAYASDIGSAMLVGVDFPELGCWRITGKYNDAELSFVVWVAP